MCITGKVRSFALDMQDRIETALRASAERMVLGAGTVMDVDYRRYYPATINSSAEAALAPDAAVVAGLQVEVAPRAAFTSEDFALVLQRCPRSAPLESA